MKRDNKLPDPPAYIRSGFFQSAGLNHSAYIQQAHEEAIAPFKTVHDDGRVSIDITAPGYFDAMSSVFKDVVPPVRNTGEHMNQFWTMPAAEREVRLRGAKAGRGSDPEMDEFFDQIAGMHYNKDSGRYVRLEHDGEESGVLMEGIPEGDVHTFYDLESPADDLMVMRLPQGSYRVSAELGPSKLTRFGVDEVRNGFTIPEKFRGYTPQQLQAAVDEMYAAPRWHGPERTGFFCRSGQALDSNHYMRQAMTRANEEVRGISLLGMDMHAYSTMIADIYKQAASKGYEDSRPRAWGPMLYENLWMSDKASIDGALAKAGTEDESIPELNARKAYERQCDLAAHNGDSGRYVKLRHGGPDGETSGYLMELERDGDVHRFLDLESPLDDMVILELPHGSFTQVAEYESCEMFKDAIGRARLKQHTSNPIRSVIPEGYEDQVAAMRDPDFKPGFFKSTGDLERQEAKARQASVSRPDPGAHTEPVSESLPAHDSPAAGRSFLPQDRPAASDQTPSTAGDPGQQPAHPATRVINGRLHRDYGNNLYHLIPVSMDDAKGRPAGDIDYPTRQSVDDVTGRAYAVIDDPVRYYNRLRDNGAIMADMALCGSGSDGAPDRHMIQVDRDVAVLGRKDEHGRHCPVQLPKGSWLDMTDPDHPYGYTCHEAESMFYETVPRYCQPAGIEPRFVNCEKGQPTPWGIAAEDACIPVAVLFNENDTTGELMPMQTTRVWNGEPGGVLVECGENFIAGHDDVFDEPMAGFENLKEHFRYRAFSDGTEAPGQAEAELDKSCQAGIV